MDNKMVQVRRSLLTAAVAAALFLGGALTWAISSNNNPVFGAPAVTLRVAPSSNLVEAQGSLREGFADVVEPLLPAVVNVSTSKVVKTSSRQSPFSDDPFFRQFFGNQGQGDGDDEGQGQGQGQQPAEQHEHSLGSGVIVSPDGYILTNNHVVDDASDIEVQLKDRRQFKATVVGKDPRTDIAVLKIPATGLASVSLGDSTKTRVGDIVLAIGDPFGVGETVTMGIVSAMGRQVGISTRDGYEDFIQTDASINPGNSGGALVNTRGELVGINTAILSNGSGGNQGIGFAIPVAMARNIMEQLIKTGKVTRGYLGVSIQAVTPELAKAFNLPSNEGALIGDVTPNSPGAKAGIQKGDVIVGLNGQPLFDYNDLRLRISQMTPGSSVKLDVFRAGQKRELTVTLAEFPEQAAEAAASPEAGSGESAALEGVQVAPLTADIAQQLKLPAGTRGVVITQVANDSPASDAGLQKGDVIQEVNHAAVTSVDQFRSAVRGSGNTPVLMLVNRGGVTLYTVLSPQQ
jgi:serine protease Do